MAVLASFDFNAGKPTSADRRNRGRNDCSRAILSSKWSSSRDSEATFAALNWSPRSSRLPEASRIRYGQSRRQRGPSLHEILRAHHQLRGAVAPQRLELQLHLVSGVQLHRFVGKRRPGDVAAQLLQQLAVVCCYSHASVQTESADVGTQRLARCGLARRFQHQQRDACKALQHRSCRIEMI
jgi:hypothetical protein